MADYEILGWLGSGGMGVVYNARQRPLNRLVALKMICTGVQDNPNLLARFRIEAEAVAVARLAIPISSRFTNWENLKDHPSSPSNCSEGGA